MKRSLTILLAASLAVSGCGIFRGGDKKPKTPVLGERLPVLSYEAKVEADPDLAELTVVVPSAVANDSWTQPGGNAAKSMGHVQLGASLTRAWTASIEGSSNTARLNSAPVVAGGRVYTIDTTATVRAFDAQTGGQVWATQFGAERGSASSLFGGGVGYGNGRVYATNGLGYAVALDGTNGGIVWQVRPGGPLRGAPTVTADAIYVVSQDNQLYSLKPADGATNWSSAAALEIAGVFGTASPAFGQGTVVAGFSSGELNAYRYENGRLVWQDQLSRTSITTSVSSLSDIDAAPVIDRGQVIAVGQGGRMVALELITGQRIWELNIAGISTPWVAGDWVFVVTADARLLAVARSTGRIRWITQLRAFERERAKRAPISWSGPLLAGGRLILAASDGALINVDPATGAIQSQTDVRASVSLSPVVANSTLYILDDDGRLHAFR